MTTDSGKMSFQVVLMAFLNDNSDGLKISTGVSVQVSNHGFAHTGNTVEF